MTSERYTTDAPVMGSHGIPLYYRDPSLSEAPHPSFNEVCDETYRNNDDGVIYSEDEELGSDIDDFLKLNQLLLKMILLLKNQLLQHPISFINLKMLKVIAEFC